MSILTKIFGDSNQKYLNKFSPVIEKINQLEKKFEGFSDSELKNLKTDFQKRLQKGEKLDDILPEAFASVREAAKRTLGQRHYDVQLLGGIILHQGQIAEMRTGEGKTLAATLPVYLNALEGQGVHVVTVNDYLARRDSVWMGQIYHALGMSIGCIQHEAAFLYDEKYATEPDSEASEADSLDVKDVDEKRDEVGGYKVVDEFLRPVERKQAYAADITYGTNNEFGFDYLRDNMVQSLQQKAQRGLHYAIVDEVDSILIDEARTPLIISAPDATPSDQYKKFAALVRQLKETEDYNIDEKMRAATLTEAGIAKLENWLGMENIYTEGGIGLVHHIEQALRAETLFKLDRDYVISAQGGSAPGGKDGEIIIVDEFTGRLMHGRRYSEGLHQAIEAKEGVVVQRESRTLATITFQNLFRMYKKLSGMTGTAATEAEEFSKIYRLDVTVIPTNKPMIRNDQPDRIYKNEPGKFKAVIKDIVERHKLGQPVLVGTISIEKNEILGELLARKGIEPNILNAKQHEKEGNVIAQAGRLGAVTVATNMAGRGVDVILGGNPPDPENAKKVRDLGGLHIIGTERHESRRIDNQLRGRAGRQGDPGSSQFHVSLEDDLMRIFGSDRVKKMMDVFKIPEDMPIENKMVSRSLESAQKKVEGYNFDTRKHLVEYDDVINKHREAIYRKRNEVLELSEASSSGVIPSKSRLAGRAEGSAGSLSSRAERSGAEGSPGLQDDDNRGSLKPMILEMVEQEIEQVVMFHTANGDEKSWDLKEIYEVASTIFPIDSSARVELADIKKSAGDKLQDAKARTKIIEYLVSLSQAAYENLETQIQKALGENAMRQIEKMIMLRAIDLLWMEHLDAMDQMRQGIGLRGYGQLDPLIEYKKEAYRMFNELMNLINKQIVYSIYKIGFAQKIAPEVSSTANLQFSAPSKTMEAGGSAIARAAAGNSGLPVGVPANRPDKTATEREVEDRNSHRPVQNAQTHYNGEKVGRNDPCPCGATKPDGTPVKFKHCHGK